VDFSTKFVMNLQSFHSFCLVLLAFLFVHEARADISDDECGVWVDEETTTIAAVTDKPANVSTPKGSKRDEYFRKRVVKKSLVIVFDGTSSMTDDLAQMREAAKEIISSLSARKDKPIKNYVLTVFKDPSE
jgi:hypothetical protein